MALGEQERRTFKKTFNASQDQSMYGKTMSEVGKGFTNFRARDLSDMRFNNLETKDKINLNLPAGGYSEYKPSPAKKFTEGLKWGTPLIANLFGEESPKILYDMDILKKGGKYAIGEKLSLFGGLGKPMPKVIDSPFAREFYFGAEYKF
jgi:hypothetical protein|tara:strand:+ start:148 stop:594 length:447 start_codon:yes stop_codon:yes gene_type:complete